MPAGTETTVTVIRSTMLHLLTSPATYHKVKQEIADGIKAGRISRPITNEQGKAMPYLQAAIMEGMRMVPPVISGFAKRVPSGGDTSKFTSEFPVPMTRGLTVPFSVCGKFLPEGTEIYTNYVVAGRNPEVYGEDADIFRP